MKKGRTNGAKRLVKELEQAGVDYIFAYPGGANLPIYEALSRSSVKAVLARHEQGAAHMADGYARAGGKSGCCLATSGPGATNLVTGIATAYMDSSPVVAITGQVSKSMIGNDAFQEVDITGITMPITKHNSLVQRSEEIGPAVAQAFYLAGTGRKGPVLIDIPKDLQQAEFALKDEPAFKLEGYSPTISGHTGQIKRAAGLINCAKRPVIISGGGVFIAEAFAQMADFNRRAGFPVVHTLMGKAGYDNADPLNFGLFGYHGRFAANKAVSEADLIIAVGTRFGDRSTGPLGNFAPDARIVHIDIDPAEIGKNVPAYLPIVGDIAEILPRLQEQIDPGFDPNWLESLRKEAEDHPLPLDSDRFSTPSILVEIASQHPDPILVTDVGRHQIYAAQYYPVGAGRKFISSGGLGTMGFGLPAAIGAKLARPDQDVVLISGDGSFQMNMQELSLAGELGIDLTMVVIHDKHLGMISQLQDAFYGSRFDVSRIGGSVSFSALAEALGCRGRRATNRKELQEALKLAASEGGPQLIECMVEDEEHVYPMVTGSRLTDLIEGVE